MGDLHHIGTQDLHACHIGSLLFDVHSAHINVALQTEISGGGSHRHAMLTGTGLGDDLFLAHVLCQHDLAHAVVQLVSAGVVQIFPLDIQLHPAQLVGQTLQMGDGGGTALELLADAAQLGDELAGLADGEIGLGDLVHGPLQLGRHIGAAVFAKITVFIGIMLKIGFEINVIQFHKYILLKEVMLKLENGVSANTPSFGQQHGQILLIKEKRPGQTPLVCQGRIHDPRCHLDLQRRCTLFRAPTGSRQLTYAHTSRILGFRRSPRPQRPI